MLAYLRTVDVSRMLVHSISNYEESDHDNRGTLKRATSTASDCEGNTQYSWLLKGQTPLGGFIGAFDQYQTYFIEPTFSLL